MSAYCIPLAAHGVQCADPELGATASGAQSRHWAASFATALAVPAEHTFAFPSVPAGVFASNVHDANVAALPSLTSPNPPTVAALFDVNVQCLKVGPFAMARNAPPPPSAARLPSNAVLLTDARASPVRCNPPPSEPAVLPVNDDALRMSEVKTARRPPPSRVALLRSMTLANAIARSAAPVASMQPPNCARFSEQIVALRASVEELCTAIAPPPPARAVLEWNVQFRTMSIEDSSTSSAPPSPSATAHASNVAAVSVAPTDAATLRRVRARSPSAEKCRSESAMPPLFVCDEPMIVTAAPACFFASPPRKRKPVSSKRAGESTVKHTPVLHTSVQQPLDTPPGSGGVAQRRATSHASGVAIGAVMICVAQLNVTARAPSKP